MLPWQIFIQIDNGLCCVSVPAAPNEMLKPSEVKELIPILQKYIEENTDEEIEKENKLRWEKTKRDYGIGASKPDYESCAGGCVYLFECGGKYKIGVSNNVNRRVKDLDNRPFKVNIVAQVYSDIAYKVEQTIHTCLKKHNIKGEWYDFPTPPTAEWFNSLVKRVEDDKRRTNE